MKNNSINHQKYASDCTHNNISLFIILYDEINNNGIDFIPITSLYSDEVIPSGIVFF